MAGNITFDGWMNDDGSENFKCRAWVNFDGTGTVAIRNSGNVSSITDNGTGNYRVNFINSMPDTNYATIYSHNAAQSGTTNVEGGMYSGAGGQLVDSVPILVELANGSEIDLVYNYVTIFR